MSTLFASGHGEVAPASRGGAPFALAGYEVTATVYHSAQSLVCRGRRTSDGRPVILKALDEEYPHPVRLARFARELSMMRRLSGAGIIEALALEARGRSQVIVMEDIGGRSLDRVLAEEPLPIAEILRIAVRVAEILGRVHAAGITHKDVNPANLVYRKDPFDVRLIDFGIATALSREGPEIAEGTPAYLSPEQTGRMNRGTDYRTDFYSLGATLYHLAAGRLPFPTGDAMELFHCHLAREPVPLHEASVAVPESFAAIVSRLMAKTAEDRYQSAEGLRADLLRCEAALAAGDPSAFPLGRDDVSDRFQIAEKLYGREREAEALLAVFERARHGRAEVCLLPGYSGIGKSALVHELYRPITGSRGHLGAGKFDQLARHVPYTAVIEAIQGVVRQMLTEREQDVAACREAILVALGPNARVISDVIPEVALVIGAQPEVPELPPVEAQNRFRLAFRAFVRALAAADRPLVLVLDDLQWADLASLGLIELVAADPEIRHALILGAYRDNEVDAGHPLSITRKAVEAAGCPVSVIHLGALGRDDVIRLVADATRAAPDEVGPLAELCLEKTGGNPFFLRQFLHALHAEGLLAFDPSRRCFRFNLEEIRRVGITDNVVDLMAGRIQKLPEEAQAALRTAACIGGTFDLATLAVVRGRRPTETAADLWPALVAGLLSPLDSGYTSVADSDECDVSYRFVHDRVQQAAYALIPEGERAGVHLGIGRRLRDHARGSGAPPPSGARAPGREPPLFEIANHLNLARALVVAPDERDDLARVNLAAGKKATDAAAFGPALRYLTAGLSLLGERRWERAYRLCLELTTAAAGAALLAGEAARMDALVEEVLARAHTLLERVPAYEVRIQGHLDAARHLDGVKLGLLVLEQLGVKMPLRPSQARVVAGLLSTKARLLGKSVEDLERLPAMTDPAMLAAMRLIIRISSAVYVSAAELVPVVVFKLVELSVGRGNAPESGYGYSCYGLALCGYMGDFDTGYRFGQLALRLVEAPERHKLRAKSVFHVAFFVAHWKRPVREALPALLDAYRGGLQVGDLEYAFHGAYQRAGYSFEAGLPIGEILAEVEGFGATIRKTSEGGSLRRLLLVQQVLLNLQGASGEGGSPPWVLRGSALDAAAHDALRASDDGYLKAAVHYQQLVLACLFHQPAVALEEADRWAALATFMASTFYVPVAHQHLALAALALVPAVDPPARRALYRRADEAIAKMRGWARHAPANHAHRLALMEAERARVSGDHGAAREGYDRAVTLARENGFLQGEAFASELAGRFYLSVHNERVAAIHLKDAHYAYLVWGATAKVRDLEARHAAIFAARPSTPEPATVTTTGTGPVRSLDVLAVTRASQAISGEVVLDDLLRRLMTVLLESAGAQRGVLLLRGESPRAVASERSAQGGSPLVHLAPEGEQAAFSEGIVRYVERTGETVVLGDAAAKGPFVSDPYVAARRSRSILCTPIVRQKQVMGLLYLENDLAADAFTPERRETLDLLSAQTAISIENARLYDTLDNRVKERTRELSQALDRLRETQQQLLVQEKLASLGMLTSGIAHEIKNPLNFVVNFAESSVVLAGELAEAAEGLREGGAADPDRLTDVADIAADLRQNAAKIQEHGKRADAIVTAMLKHSRTGGGDARKADLNGVAREYGNLAWQAARALPGAPAELLLALDPRLAPVTMVPEDIGRVVMNLVTNALHAVSARRKAEGPGYAPEIRVATEEHGDRAVVRVRDNGTGIPRAIRDEVFKPFFTTKPAGEGTGLGLSISWDIVVNGHAGTLQLESEEGAFTELTMTLPRRAGASS